MLSKKTVLLSIRHFQWLTNGTGLPLRRTIAFNQAQMTTVRRRLQASTNGDSWRRSLSKQASRTIRRLPLLMCQSRREMPRHRNAGGQGADWPWRISSVMLTLVLPVTTQPMVCPKYIAFGAFGLMLLFVLWNNERLLLAPQSPQSDHFNPIRRHLIPHRTAGFIALALGALQFSTRLRKLDLP